jgi:curli biogenesis system outer membrane secretion channel CsgG
MQRARHSGVALARGGFLAALALASACHKDEPAASAEPPKPAHTSSVAAAQPAANPIPAKPDFGGVTSEHIETTGAGVTLEAAVDNAIRTAIEQVNGKAMTSGSASLNYTAQLRAGGQSLDLQSSQFADWLATQSHGVVSHFRILSQQQVNQPTATDEQHLAATQGESWNKGSVDASEQASSEGHARAEAGDASASADGKQSASASVSGEWDQHQGASSVDYSRKHTDFASHWEVKIAADVATYRESAAAKLTRVVIALPRFKQAAFQVGDTTVAADDIAGQIRTSLNDALVQTHRFTVLDRDATAEIGQEIDLIASGNAKTEDTARLGQQLSTDLIVIPTIDRFEYLRHERQLRMSDRTLASYSGGGALSFRVVNAVTGQIVMSKSFNYALPDTAPTTLGASANGAKLTAMMMDSLHHDIVHAILQNTYPLMVLQADGKDLVINQGGDNVRAGTTYQAVTMGKEIIDPQSGQSLGRSDKPCCTVLIDRVTPTMSYGHIVEDGVDTGSFTPGSMELRDEVATASAKSPARELANRSTVARQVTRKAADDKPQAADTNW